jgi:hypothetical protein
VPWGGSVSERRAGQFQSGRNIAARGGGLYASDGDVLIGNSLILGNSCSASTVPSTCGSQSGVAEGGGVFLAGTVSNVTMKNTVVGCNQTQTSGPATIRRGSGIQTAAAVASIVNCTIARNSDEGLRIDSGTVSVRNSIVYFHPVASIQGATATVCYSDIQGGYGGCTGNFDLNPAFAGAGCLPEHYALLPFSPSIDAGDPAAVFNDGCHPPASGGSRNDMGALGGPDNCAFREASAMTCAAQTYGSLRQGQNGLTLGWTFAGNQSPFPGMCTAGNGTPQGPAMLLLAFGQADTVLSGVTILVDPATVTPLPIVLDATGSWRFPFQLELPFLAGVPLFLQALDLPVNGVARGSNGLRLAPCF